MAAVRMRLTAELRTRWRAWAAVALLIGFAGGVVLLTAAGARRTNTAYGRFLHASHASDFLLFPRVGPFIDAVARLPQVESVAPIAELQTTPVDRRGRPVTFQPIGGFNRAYGTVIDRPKIVAGRMFHADDAREAVADVRTASQYHLRPGSPFTFSLTNAQGPGAGVVRNFAVRIVGVVATRTDAVAVSKNDTSGSLLVTPALLRHVDASYFGYDAVLVRVRRGESANRVARSAVALSRHFPGLSKIAGFISETDQAGKIERAIRPQAIALAVFALLAALGALVIMGQIVSRQLFVSASDFPDLRALGVSRRQLLAITRAEIAAVAVVGMALAATFAVIASPLVLFGPARVIEPHPGIAPDWALLAVGAATIVVILMCLAEWPARRIANRALSSATIPTVEGRSTRVAHAAASLPTGPSATVGVRLALDPGAGRSAVPVRSTIAGIVIAVVSVTAAVTFGSNLVRLVHTPRLYGQTWTVAVDAQFGAVPTSAFVDLVGKQPGVDAWTFGDYVNLTAGGRDLPAIDLIRGRGAPLAPTILAGRAPAAADEIALGTKTLDQLGSRVGGSVVIPVGSRHVRFEVVGRAVLPAFSQGSFTPTGLGQGAVVWGPGIARLVPPGNGTAGPGAANFVLVHVARGAQQSANVAHFINAMQTNRTCPIGLCQFVRVQRPTDIVNYSRLETTPRILAALLAAFALASLAHLLMTSVRRRRRDIAVLRTLGFVRRQVFAIVGWQATTIVAVALAVGLPVGVLGGHWLWTEFATRVGVDAKGVIPILAILAAVAVTLVIANLLAAVPGWLAGRLRLATALRDE